MIRRATLVLVAAVLVDAGCGTGLRAPVPPAEDYLFPAPGPGELSRSEVETLRAAWKDILSADLSSALHRIERLERSGAERPAVETAAAYARLRAGRGEEAQRGFAAVLERVPSYVPALAGAGSTAARLGDADASLVFYKRALAASPGDGPVRRRVTALKLQLTERHIALARVALQGGDADGAARAYRNALEAAPEVAAVRIALADLLLGQANPAEAIAALSADPSGDRQVKLRLATLLVEAGRFEPALDVYRELLGRDPADAAARAGYAVARDRFETALMPEEYRRIPDATQVTRADLAALLVTRVKALRRAPPGTARLAVDVSGSWAREQVLSALSLEIMDVYPNHTFQPGAVVRRADLARTAARVLDLLRWPRTATAAEASDVPRSHLDHDAVERTLAAGLMTLTEKGAFEPWRPVPGREALEVIDALERLVGP